MATNTPYFLGLGLYICSSFGSGLLFNCFTLSWLVCRSRALAGREGQQMVTDYDGHSLFPWFGLHISVFHFSSVLFWL